jgi:hypothetical protein
MPKAISNTSPLLYLYKIGAINLLPKMFDEVWTAESVKNELLAGRSKGYDVPNPADYPWLNIVNPKSMPSEWLALDLGAGELGAMALAVLATSLIRQFFGILGRNFFRRFSFTLQGGLGLFSEYALGSFG